MRIKFQINDDMYRALLEEASVFVIFGEAAHFFSFVSQSHRHIMQEWEDGLRSPVFPTIKLLKSQSKSHDIRCVSVLGKEMICTLRK